VNEVFEAFAWYSYRKTEADVVSIAKCDEDLLATNIMLIDE
jgi:hypothetical protein